MLNKKVHTFFSHTDLINSLIWRCLFLIGVGFCFIRYQENPPVFMFIGVLCSLLVISFGENIIVIYEDRIVNRTNSILSFVLRLKGMQIDLSAIAQLYLKPNPPESKPLEVATMFLMQSMLPGRERHLENKKTPICIELKTGKIIEWQVDFNPEQKRKIVAVTNQLIN